MAEPENDDSTKIGPEDREWLERLEREYSTTDYKKLFAYFKEVVQSDHFQSTIRRLRKEIGVPNDGLEDKKSSHQLPPTGSLFLYISISLNQ